MQLVNVVRDKITKSDSNAVWNNTVKALKLEQLSTGRTTMKLAVLGATGPSGQLVVERALKKGHEVVALVRSPEKIQVTDDKLKVVKVDILNADDLAQHMRHCHAVISCLGSPYQILSEITLYSTSAKAIVGAMKQAKVKRFVFLSSWFVQDQPDHPWKAKYFIKPVLSRFLTDLRKMENYLINECPDVDFTSVRPPALTNNDIDGRVLQMEADIDWSEKMALSMPRADLAVGVLKIVDENLFIRKGVCVGLPDV